MPFTLIILGVVLLVAAVRGTQDDLFALVKGDLTGPNNFIYWLVAILFIGSIGYIPKLRPLSITFMVLVVIVLVLARGNPNTSGGGFFQKFTDALKSTQTAQGATATTKGSAFSTLPDLQNLLAFPLTF